MASTTQTLRQAKEGTGQGREIVTANHLLSFVDMSLALSEMTMREKDTSETTLITPEGMIAIITEGRLSIGETHLLTLDLVVEI